MSGPVRLAALNVPPARRAVAVGMQAVLVVLLGTLAAALDTDPLTRIVLLLAAAAAGFQAAMLWRATAGGLVLTDEGLFEEDGREVARLDSIARVDRGAFAFKPSNGFLITLSKPAPRAWRPGLWWRFGRRVGIGGATSGKAARDMADLIALLKTDRGPEIVATARRAED